MNIQERIEILEKQLAELKAEANVEPWEPIGGQWFVSSGGEVLEDRTARSSQYFGVERPTEKLAERALVIMRRFNRLLAYHDEFCPEHDPSGVWDGNTANYTIYKINTYNTSYVKQNDFVTVYFPEEIAKELCRKLNSGEVAL